MAVSLLVGNGINRLNNEGISWPNVLQQLIQDNPSAVALEHITRKPFTLLYEEIVLSQAQPSKRSEEFATKKRIAALVDRFNPNPFHIRLMSADVRHILTTNYDYTLERARTPKFPRDNMQAETKYSLFRRRAAEDKRVWHIHGEVHVPNTITLGYDQYSGYLQKLRTYSTAERTGDKSSPFKRREIDFDVRRNCVYSWLDIFFRDDIHIVGLGLDYTEMDLWWALTYKHRLGLRGFPVGKTYFYDWHTDVDDEDRLAKGSLLAGLGVTVLSVRCTDGFETAYDSFLKDKFAV